MAAATLIPLDFARRVYRQAAFTAEYRTGKARVTHLSDFAATGLPEEILFRSLIQNWLTQRFGSSNGVVGMAALIFGVSHLNNAPGTLPNWRDAIVALFSRLIFGMVFNNSATILSSALVRTGGNTVKYFFLIRPGTFSTQNMPPYVRARVRLSHFALLRMRIGPHARALRL